MCKLSILIPTHNRPILFDRALKSALHNKPENVEIICNNDSLNVYTARTSTDVSCYYHTYDNLSDVYKFLLSQANGEYIYFLEDDDYLKEDFYDVVMQLLGLYDIISGNYYPKYNTTILTSHTNGTYTDKKQYAKSVDFNHLQLSKFIFRKSVVDCYEFKADNNVHNDIDFFLHAVTKGSNFINIPNILYFQTVDGRDNISFEEFNTNIEANEEFYENYKELWD